MEQGAYSDTIVVFDAKVNGAHDRQEVLDFYELAYLRGDCHAAFKLYLLELVQWGCVSIYEKRGLLNRKIYFQTTSPPEHHARSTDLHAHLARMLFKPRTRDQLFDYATQAIFEQAFARYEARLIDVGLLHKRFGDSTVGQTSKGWFVSAIVLFVLGFIGVLPSWVSYAAFALFFAGIVFTNITGRKFPHLTTKGDIYVKGLQSEYLDLKDAAYKTQFGASDVNVILGYALFGDRFLLNTPYDLFAHIFEAEGSTLQVGMAIGGLADGCGAESCDGCCG